MTVGETIANADAQDGRHAKGGSDVLQEKYPFSAEQLRIIIESIPANVFFKDPQGRYQVTSHICSMLNAGDGGSIVGKTDLDIQPDHELGRRFYEEDLRIAETHETMSYLQEMLFDGQAFYYNISKAPVFDGDGAFIGTIGMVSDMTEQVNLQRELEKRSVIDEMTGAFNRSYYEEIADSPCEELPCSVIVADCNGLKRVNDTYGHKQGDSYILAIVNNIRRHLDDSASLVRIGGDEFLAVLPGCDERACAELLGRIRETEGEVAFGGAPVSAALGMTVVTDARTTLAEAVAKADAAMYEEKRAHRARGAE